MTLEQFELDDQGLIMRCPAGHNPRNMFTILCAYRFRCFTSPSTNVVKTSKSRFASRSIFFRSRCVVGAMPAFLGDLPSK